MLAVHPGEGGNELSQQSTPLECLQIEGGPLLAPSFATVREVPRRSQPPSPPRRFEVRPLTQLQRASCRFDPTIHLYATFSRKTGVKTASFQT
ncbi:hypothetical protein RB195_022066 [Necator americanus]|uniref:Uncharacterized protein n=1 Tax=Necator americanus TaxID=51031 RepID=A0ABR1EE39_NECAM